MNGFFRCAIKLLVGFVLITIPVLCLAQAQAIDAAGSSPLWDMFKNLSFQPPIGDMSVGFLTKIFGAVPGVPQFAAGGSTILGAIFGIFNAGILALSGVFLSYTITRIVTETTMDGAAMGKSTTIWTAVRCALSTSLLVPQVSGYSMINGIVMWVVVQSVGLADLTWSRAMDYLKEGGPVYAPPTSMVDYSLINWDVKVGNIDIDSDDDVNVGSVDVLRSLTCAHAVYGALKESQRKKRNSLRGKNLDQAGQKELANASKIIPERGEVFSVYKQSTGYTTYQFPYVEDGVLEGYGLNLKPSEIPTNLSGICGTIYYGIGGADDETKGRYIPAKLSGLQNMIAILEPTAKRLIEDVKPNDEGEKKLDINKYVVYNFEGEPVKFFTGGSGIDRYLRDNQAVKKLENDARSGKSLPAVNWPVSADEVLSAAAAYQITLAPAQRGGQDDSLQDKQKNFEEAKQKGWIGAAGYYRLLAKLQKEVRKEYSRYRLTGYQSLSAPFGSKMGNRVRLPYGTLFPKATEKNSDEKTPIGVIDAGYQDVLDDALTWIYLSYPYAKLHGQTLASSLSETEVVGESPITWFGSDNDIVSGISIAGIIALQTLGGVLLPVTQELATPILMSVPVMWLAYDVNQVFAVWRDNMSSPDKVYLDPILKLQNLGNQMLTSAMDFSYQMTLFYASMILPSYIVTKGALVASGVAAPFSFMSATSGVSNFLNSLIISMSTLMNMAQTIIFMFIPLGIAVMGPMFVSGVIFSVYVPLIPYLLFLFGSISWLISVLVLMAAAPVICFLMLWGNSSQENPLLAREAEQFVMQVVGVFLRPTLMIIGLIAGMVLSYIGVDLLNLGFFKIAAGIMPTAGGAFGIPRLDVMVIKQVALVIVYTFTMLTVVNMCFSTIYLLYSEAMRVAGIAAPAVGMEERQLEAVKGATTQAAEAYAGGMKETTTALKGATAPSMPSGKKEGKGKGKGGGAKGEKADAGKNKAATAPEKAPEGE